jgi:alpha-ketoglutaric semialdehyde dehydrogenase
MRLEGTSIIGYRRGATSGTAFQGFDPSLGKSIEPAFYSASATDVDQAVGLADHAFSRYRLTLRKQRAAFLNTVAENLMSLGDELIERAVSETGLPPQRLKAERERTCFQLRFFADMVERGSWVDARIDHSNPQRVPTPKIDARSMLQPLGAVAVFCASNFPLAFSVAGGDTASALASGNAVVVLAHYSHPGTAEIAGQAIREAAFANNLPDGVFSLLFDAGHSVAHSIVQHPGVRAVGFTGSRAGGLALMRLAQARPTPIPFFAEMSSVNPVFILPGALETEIETLAKSLASSATQGVGQFCTNPGVVVSVGNAEALIHRFSELMDATPAGVMLNPHIASSYKSAVEKRSSAPRIRLRVRPLSNGNDSGCRVRPTVFETDLQGWLQNHSFRDEIFGPTTLIVRTTEKQQLLEFASSLEGNLTASILGTPQDLVEFSDLLRLLETKVGRIIWNGFPTGVEVCEAMVHGGPYPATSDGRSTSVGGRAILRFTRPICYQDFPNEALPQELQNKNPAEIWRLEDGNFEIGSQK